MVSKKALDKRKTNLVELFKLATEHPEQAQQSIQQFVQPPYSTDYWLTGN